MQGNLNSPNLYRSQFQPVSSQQGFSMMLYMESVRKAYRSGQGKRAEQEEESDRQGDAHFCVYWWYWWAVVVMSGFDLMRV